MKKSLVLISIVLLLSFSGVLYSQKESDALVPALRYVPKSMLAWILAEPFRPEFYTQESDPADWSDAIKEAARAAMEQNGNTVKFACGRSYHIARKLHFDGLAQVKFVGCASDFEAQGRPATVTYSGAEDSAFSFRSSYGIRLQYVKLEYTNPAFNGILVDFRHSVHNPNADSAYFTIEDSTLTGTPQANQATLLAIDGAIISRVKVVHFFHGKIGIRGMSAETGNYSNVVTIAECSFNAVDVGIMNYSSNWNMTTNTFEPNKFGEVVAVDYDCMNCQFASAVTYHNNYHGDAHAAQQKPLAKFVKTLGLVVSANWGIIEHDDSRVAFELVQSSGASFFGNRLNSFANFIETTGGTTFDLNVFGNQTGAREMVLQTTPVVGLNIMQPSTHGNIFAGVASNGETYEHQQNWGVSIGRISAIGRENAFAEIGILDGATGYLNRSLGYFAPSSNNNPHIFFTWNGSEWRNRFQIGDKNISTVPLSVPDDKYNPATWKNSLEVPTKKALYEAFEAHLASVSALVEKQQALEQK